jgi:hypothetical protein
MHGIATYLVAVFLIWSFTIVVARGLPSGGPRRGHPPGASDDDADDDASAGDHNGPPGSRKQPPTIGDEINSDITRITDYCQADIEQYCPHQKRVWILICLEEKKEHLSQACRDYLGNTVIGGCNNDAQTLCPTMTHVDDIAECLNEHKYELQESCFANLNNDSPNPWNSMQERSEHATRAITAMSLAYLLIPMVLAIWTSIMMWNLHRDQKQVLSESMLVDRDSSSPSPQSVDGASIDSETAESSRAAKQWQIGFLNVSYWVHEIVDWSRPWETTRTQILREVRARTFGFDIIGGRF